MATTSDWEQPLEQLSRKLGAESAYYWQCHAPRYRYLAALLTRFAAGRNFSRILDIGMSFETLLLERLFPASTIDAMGIEDDPRFRPENALGTFHCVDLNLAGPGAAAADALPRPAPYDLIICMEVLEHLIQPPESVFAYLASLLTPAGLLVVTTPNAAWLKNRLKLLRGKNPFELLSSDPHHRGHIREYTLNELTAAAAAAGLEPVLTERRGLYRFNNRKDRVYSAVANLSHSSLRRTLVAIFRQK